MSLVRECLFRFRASVAENELGQAFPSLSRAASHEFLLLSRGSEI
jgi:hypothetical protein